MASKVRITPLALEDLRNCVRFYVESGSPDVAAKWLSGLHECLGSLKVMPTRCALAPENDDLEFELRQIRYKSHRVLFTVTKAGNVVVLRIYHSASKACFRQRLSLTLRGGAGSDLPAGARTSATCDSTLAAVLVIMLLALRGTLVAHVRAPHALVAHVCLVSFHRVRAALTGGCAGAAHRLAYRSRLDAIHRFGARPARIGALSASPDAEHVILSKSHGIAPPHLGPLEVSHMFRHWLLSSGDRCVPLPSGVELVRA